MTMSRLDSSSSPHCPLVATLRIHPVGKDNRGALGMIVTSSVVEEGSQSTDCSDLSSTVATVSRFEIFSLTQHVAEEASLEEKKTSPALLPLERINCRTALRWIMELLDDCVDIADFIE
jgi:hypothetical protein